MIHKSFFGLALAALLVVPAALQAQSDNHDSTPNWALYGGYSRIFKPYDRTTQNAFSGGENGWDTSLTVPLPFIGNWIDVTGDVSGYYRNDFPNFHPRDYFFMIGPQVQGHIGHWTIFADGLVGSSHLDSSALPNLKSNNTFAIQAGAGIDAGFSRVFAWRFKGDFYNTRYQSTNNNVSGVTNSNWRLATGPVLRF